MSVENIRELFRKRLTDAVNSNLRSQDCDSDGGKKEESEREESNADKCLFESLTEESAGITAYLSRGEGFNAVVKERYSDFQVNEIDLDGNAVRLTNFDVPVTPVPAVDVADDLLDDETWDKLKSLEEKKIDEVAIDVTQFDKDKRRDVHKLIKKRYKQFSANTVSAAKADDGTERKSIVVTLRKDVRDSWPCEKGKYLHCVLFKVNMDTMDAINVIANKLSIKVSNFAYAGTKDKRGKTSQQISIWHLSAERLNSINNCLGKIKVGNYSYKNTQLKLGDLKGNQFKIALRNVTADDEVIECAMNSLRDNGFINYFGLQRFGNSPEIPTFKIGKSLLKGDFKTAIDLILKPREEKTRKDGLEEARRIWWDTRDAKRAYNVLKSKNRTYEGKLLLGLTTHGSNAYVNALDSLPRNVRLLYLHSYQSLLWNKIVSKRVKEFGAAVLEGDLVRTENDEVNEEVDDDSDEGAKDVVPPVRTITAEEVDKFQIYDIVHPLPGYNIMYPDNVIRKWYEELLEEEGLALEEFKQNIKKYSLSGTYRNIVKKVKDLTWKVVHYSKPEDDLILSDLDAIENKVLDPDFGNSGCFKAILMNFSLDSSTYATMAIREVIKINISSSYQASLNSYSHKRKCEDGDASNKKMKV